jgi:hypothetical protein
VLLPLAFNLNQGPHAINVKELLNLARGATADITAGFDLNMPNPQDYVRYDFSRFAFCFFFFSGFFSPNCVSSGFKPNSKLMSPAQLGPVVFAV